MERGSADFPTLLEKIADPPNQLYLQGSKTALRQPAVSIVGSRQATEYGRRQTIRFAAYLAKRGVVIVSGLAYGIDLTAHETAIASGASGRSVAVIAGGLNVALMSWQEELATRIIKAGGAVISEYAPEQPAFKSHFPERNRIIAGLAPVTLITEARERSGALITARLAAEAGRTVMVVPHDVDRVTAAGSNRLIRDGANVALEPRDVFEELLRHLPEDWQEQLLSSQKNEFNLLHALAKPTLLDQLAERLGRPPADLMRQVTELELEGKIKRTADGKFTSSTHTHS